MSPPRRRAVTGSSSSSPSRKAGSCPAASIHDKLSEHFEVLEGRITFHSDGNERTLGPGDEITVRAGTWHRWWNSGDGEVRTRVRIEPALRFEEMTPVIWGLCADGQTSANGTPSPLLGALFASRYRDEIRLRQPPELVQRIVLPPLAALARVLGKERTLERYLDLDAHPSAERGLGRLPEQIMRRRTR